MRDQRDRMQPDDGLLVLAHSAPGLQRAQQLFGHRADTDIAPAGAGVRGAADAARMVARSRSAVIYLIDIGISTSVAAVAGRLRRRRVVVDTGDLVFALERSRGERSRRGLALVWLGERIALACAHRVVVRGHRHADFLRRQPLVAPDLSPADARVVGGDPVRRALGLDRAFVVGLVGSLNRAPALATTYGWDLVEALPELPEDVHGLIVGDGPGRSELAARAHALGLSERLHLVGRMQGKELLAHIGAMDVAISTQTNDAVGAVRTTGKLPFYLACGCPVLASDVGEAHRLLRPLGWTIRYEGVVDPAYPQRLAQRIREWSRDGAGAARRAQARALYESDFDPDPVIRAVNDLVDTLRAGV